MLAIAQDASVSGGLTVDRSAENTVEDGAVASITQNACLVVASTAMVQRAAVFAVLDNGLVIGAAGVSANNAASVGILVRNVYCKRTMNAADFC